MTSLPDFRALLDRLGYGPTQAAEAVGCTRRTIERVLRGDTGLPGPIWHALRYHAMLLDAGLAERIPAPRMGRPPRSS